MKYRVILQRDTPGGGNPDGFAVTAFSVLADAVACAQAWGELPDNAAWLYDGNSWTVVT
jgi:hypothetical protein